MRTRGVLLGVLAATAVLIAPAPAGALTTQPSVRRSAVQLPAGFQPEGVTSMPGGTYYTGSLADGRIWTGDLDRGTGRQLLAGVTGRQLRGMQVDRRSGLLWATGQEGSGDDVVGVVLAVDPRSGTVKHRFTVAGAKFLNDVVVTRKALWVTDSGVDVLVRIPLERHGQPFGALTRLELGSPWPRPEGNRANGIRELPDGSLLVDNSTAGGLWTVDPRIGTVREIPVTGGRITGGDGLELSGHRLYVVRGTGRNEVSVVDLEQRKGVWTGAFRGALTSEALDVPSTATLRGKTLWAVNARFGVASPGTATYSIVPLATGRR